MTVSITITRASDNSFVMRTHGDSMAGALHSAIKDAKRIAVQQGDLYLRDCLGGLRAGVHRNDNGNIVVRKTS